MMIAYLNFRTLTYEERFEPHFVILQNQMITSIPIRHTQICFLQNSAEQNSTDKHMPDGLLAVKCEAFGYMSNLLNVR